MSVVLKCNQCGALVPVLGPVTDWDKETYLCQNCQVKRAIGEQIPLPFPECVLKESPKTLKVKIKKSTPLVTAVNDMNAWLWSQDLYNRVQFKHGDSYIVIAKLASDEAE